MLPSSSRRRGFFPCFYFRLYSKVSQALVQGESWRGVVGRRPTTSASTNYMYVYVCKKPKCCFCLLRTLLFAFANITIDFYGIPLCVAFPLVVIFFTAAIAANVEEGVASEVRHRPILGRRGRQSYGGCIGR